MVGADLRGAQAAHHVASLAGMEVIARRIAGTFDLYSLDDYALVLDREVHDVLIVGDAASGQGGRLNQQSHVGRVDIVRVQVVQEVVGCGQVLVQETVCRTSSAVHRPLLDWADAPPRSG